MKVNSTNYRRDPWLRTSGYHLATWSLAGLVLELERVRPTPGTGAESVVVVLGATFLVSLTHERRIGKMAGVAEEPADRFVPMLWRATVVSLVVATIALVQSANAEWIVTTWLTGLGIAFVLWAHRIDFGWLAAIGAVILASSAVDAWALGARPDVTMPLRVFVLGLLVPAAGILMSRRFLWFRGPGGGR